VGLASCRSAFVYDDHARTLLLALKYRNRRDAMAFLAAEVAALIDCRADVLTWVPTTAARRRARGFDQAELLARAVGRRSGLPVRPLLRRLDGRPQTGRDQAGRREGPRFSVRSLGRRTESVVLIDDIVTTGATLEAAAHALSGPVGPVVHARTAAWTPRREMIRSDRGDYPPK
jgi:predicted amidophosphoribosyltransferase